jgi:hypothetical protein
LQEGYDLDDVIDSSHYWHSIGVDISSFACVSASADASIRTSLASHPIIVCCVTLRSKSPDKTKKHGYWSGRVNPTITLEHVRALPKADLNCRIGKPPTPLTFLSKRPPRHLASLSFACAREQTGQ